VTAPDIARRLRVIANVAEGARTVTPPGIVDLRAAASELDRLAAELEALNADAAALVTALAECNIARKRAEAVADAAEADNCAARMEIARLAGLLVAAEAIADAAREYVAARSAGQFYPEYPTMAMLIEQGESSGERAKTAYAALVAAVEAEP